MCGAMQRCCYGFGYARGSYFTFLLDQKGKKKSRPNDASARRLLRWPAVWSGRGFCIVCIVWFLPPRSATNPPVEGNGLGFHVSPPSKYRPRRWYNWGLHFLVSWPNVFYTLLKPCGWCRCRSGYSAYPLRYLAHCSSDHSRG